MTYYVEILINPNIFNMNFNMKFNTRKEQENKKIYKRKDVLIYYLKGVKNNLSFCLKIIKLINAVNAILQK